MRRSDFHFDLPPALIAQRPTSGRSQSRLLALEGATATLRDLEFADFPGLIDARDLLVLNDTRVIPARVHGVKDSGGRVEILLERALDANSALVHLKASKGLREGAVVTLPGGHSARMQARSGALFRLRFSCDVVEFFESHGKTPLPPYIDRPADEVDRERYQTVYARVPGAVAAPTAGLHFDAQIFSSLEERRVPHAFVTLHVGAGTFQPVRADDIEAHEMHEEFMEVPQATCEAVNAARARGGRVIAVGTTVVRSLETAASCGVPQGPLAPYRGATRIFIRPGHVFRAVDAMVTNFHLPESTLLMLCAAFVGREPLLAAYRHAVDAGYRFFSYGDAMFLTPATLAPPRVAS
jgi:S-adenosylmethionine:tRNA ribosyltransferase-isomerase